MENLFPDFVKRSNMLCFHVSKTTNMRYINLIRTNFFVLCSSHVRWFNFHIHGLACLWATGTKESGQWLDGYCSCCWRLWCESHPIFARGLGAVGVLVYNCIFMLFSLSSLKSYPNWLMWQVKGQEVENFIVAAQDRSKNAHNKSMQAAYSAWVESLRSDQAQFESQRILPPDCTKSYQIQTWHLNKPRVHWLWNTFALVPWQKLKKIGTPTYPNYHPRSQKESGKRRAKIIGQLEDLSYQALVFQHLWTCMVWFLLIFLLNIDLLNAQPGNASSCLEDCWWLPILKPKDLQCSGRGGRVDRPAQCHQLHPRGIWWSAWMPQHRGSWIGGLVEFTCLWSSELCEIWLWYHSHLKSIGPVPSKWHCFGGACEPSFPCIWEDPWFSLCSVYPCWWHIIISAISDTAPYWSHHSRPPARKRTKKEGAKDEDDDGDGDVDVKKEEPAGDTDEESDATGAKEEDSEVRDLKYKLERLWLVFDSMINFIDISFTVSTILWCLFLSSLKKN